MNKTPALIAILLMSFTLTACTVGNATTSSQSLSDIMKKPLPMSCTYTSQESGKDVVNTIYIYNGKTRSELNGFSVITDGGFSYVWKEPLKADSQISKSKITTQNTQVYEKRDYSCSLWVPESGKFVVPSNVKVVDVDVAPKNTPESTSSTVINMCDECKKINLTDLRINCFQTYNCQ